MTETGRPSGRRRNLWIALSVAWLAAALAMGLLLTHTAFTAGSDNHTGSTAASKGIPTWFTGRQWIQNYKTWPAPNFSLPDQNRRPISLNQFRGKVTLLSFTSSVCRQQCPLIGRTLTTAERLMGKSVAKHTVILNVSVDPEPDSKVTVFRFAHKMGWQGYNWHYLWASRAKMKPIWKRYYVYVPNPPPIYKAGLNVIHTGAMALIDESGRIRGYFGYPFLPSEVAMGAKDLVEHRA